MISVVSVEKTTANAILCDRQIWVLALHNNCTRTANRATASSP